MLYWRRWPENNQQPTAIREHKRRPAYPETSMHYLLFYEVGDDYLARRAEFRNEHLAKGWTASDRGELVLGGALANPVNGAILLFKGDSPQVAEDFAKSDPYVLNGLVKRWYVREWTTVVGESSAGPIRPDSIRPES
jgi:hypothetical protein